MKLNLCTLLIASVAVTVLQTISSAKPAQAAPADPFHWSSAIKNSQFRYNGKRYTINEQKMGAAANFVQTCQSEVRVRGFLQANGKENWSNAEFLCGQLSVGGDKPISYNPGGEIKVFSHIYKSS